VGEPCRGHVAPKAHQSVGADASTLSAVVVPGQFVERMTLYVTVTNIGSQAQTLDDEHSIYVRTSSPQAEPRPGKEPEAG
jgi:hypothetical protein